LEGVTKQKYKDTYGVEQLENGVKLNFVTNHQHGANIGSRLYLMENDDKYKMFYLKNREFAIEVDVSNLFCGMNGAMYFVEMDEYGGKGINKNQAGAKYGTGYCDAQCPHDIKFISGEANNVNWTPNPNDLSNNMGAGKYGSCCAEMDIWEANSMATAYTPHPCDSGITQYRCEGTECGDNASGERYDGVCDKDGCDINPFRMGNPNFYGRGDQYEINTLKPMTLVTQFITDDGTDSGDLVEIKRFYVQDGKVIHSPASTILQPAGLTDSDTITDKFCEDKKNLFGDVNDYLEKGGTKGMGDSLDRGQVMVLSLWDDVEVNMLWLDSAYPLDKDRSEPGVVRGECPGGISSTPTYVRENYPDGYVIFQSAAIGEIGSTTDYPGNAPTKSPTKAPISTPGECKSWCAQNNNSWEIKCKWVKCSRCEECGTDETDSPTVSPTTTPTKSISSSPTSLPTADFDDGQDSNDGGSDDDLLSTLSGLLDILNTLVDILNQLLAALGTTTRIPNI
jgi:cellulose 1,4-beta-cellobiosidase